MARTHRPIPAEVVAFGDALRTDGAGLVPELAEPLAKIADRLIRTDGPDADSLACMWHHVMRQPRQRRPGLFDVLGHAAPPESTRARVLSFLQAVQRAIVAAELSTPPDPAIDAQAARIRAAGASLADMLHAAGVGALNFDAPAARPASGRPDLRRAFGSLGGLTGRPGAAEVIETLTERAANHLAPPMPGRRAGNPGARAFVRSLANDHRRAFGGDLPSVIATACNAMTGTRYKPQDVNDILSREPRRKWLKSKASPG